MQLHVSSRSTSKVAAARIVWHCFDAYECHHVIGHDVPHVDDDGIERPEQPITLPGTWAAAKLRHAQAKRMATDPIELITFENGIVGPDDLVTLCSRSELAAAATKFGVPVKDVRGDIAVVIWETNAGLEFWEQYHAPGPRVVRALSPVRLFPAGMEKNSVALLEHFASRGEPRSAQLAAGAARVVATHLRGHLRLPLRNGDANKQ